MVHRPGHRREIAAGTLTIGGAALALLEAPREFIRVVVFELIVDLVLGFAGWIGFWINRMFTLAADIIIDGLGAAFGPVGRSFGVLIVDLLIAVSDLVNGLVTGTGPFAPFVAVAVWIGLTVAVLLLIRFVVQAILGRYTPL